MTEPRESTEPASFKASLRRGLSLTRKDPGMTEAIALGVPAAADLLGVGRDVIRDHCNRGTLKARKIGARWSILRADLLAWYAAQPSNHADDDRLAGS